MKKIPSAVIPHLSIYYRTILESRKNFLSSEELSKLTYFSPSQIRKDLGYFGQFGIPSKGYDTAKLKRSIEKILGLDRKWDVVLVGVGNLGTALLSYKGFIKQGFYIRCAFDNDKRKIGKKINSIVIQNIKDLERTIRRQNIRIAIIALPKDAVQDIVRRLVSCGVKAILNFAPIRPYVNNKKAAILNIDLSIELERLAYFLKRNT
ncbi:MAG: redox-sensing transcriptional repressor Rex [Candidatus Omnitrophica bacterium]|nr:redox-sensing transcriptional repressor Rex [Candidatus Omnitrophota bacterium]